MKRFSFLADMLSKSGVGPSSKRGFLFWFAMVYTAVIIVNLASGGRVMLNATLEAHLYEFVVFGLVAVFGEPIWKVIQYFKDKQTNIKTPEVTQEVTK